MQGQAAAAGREGRRAPYDAQLPIFRSAAAVRIGLAGLPKPCSGWRRALGRNYW